MILTVKLIVILTPYSDPQNLQKNKKQKLINILIYPTLLQPTADLIDYSVRQFYLISD